jgi:hypothetical protein
MKPLIVYNLIYAIKAKIRKNVLENTQSGWVWWYMSIIPALGKRAKGITSSRPFWII